MKSRKLEGGSGKLVEVARRALPLMTANARAEAEAILAEMDGKTPLEAAAAAFERDMQPVRKAIVSALQSGDVEALRGLRGLLPHLLAEVNESPELADVMAFHLGKSLLDGIQAKPEDAR